MAMTRSYNQKQLQREPWYVQPKGDADVGAMAIATVRHIRNTQRRAMESHWLSFMMYGGMRGAGGIGSMGAMGAAYKNIMPSRSDAGRLKLNVARSCVDTAWAKLIQNKPKPMFLTMGGDFGSQQKAKMIDKLCAGMFYESEMYEVAAKVAKDAEIFGTGCMEITAGLDGKPDVSRVFIDEMVVDEQDGKDGKPRTIYRYRAVPRDEVLHHPAYKKHAIKIMDAGLADELMVSHSAVADTITFMEAIHLPSNPYANDGRRVVAIDNLTLVDEPWTAPDFKWLFMRWNSRSLGFWGQGIPEQLAGIQYEINELLMKVQEQMRLSGPKIFIQRGSSINSAEITNEIWGIIEYDSIEPKMMVFNTVEPELFNQINTLYQRSFEEIGISQLAARSEKPAGLNSGKALLTFNDLESGRFAPFGMAYEQLLMGAAHRCLDIARDSHMKPLYGDAEPKPFTVNAPQRARRMRFLETIKWSDVDLAKDEYVIQVFPTSLLPSEPAGKLQAIGDMMDRGMLKGDQAVALLDFPDLDSVTSLITASNDDIDMMLEQMLEEGIPLSPEPFSNLEAAAERMNSALLRAKINGVPESNLDLVRRYIEAAKTMAAPPPPPMPPEGMAPPPDAGMPPGLPPGMPPMPPDAMPPQGVQ